MRNFPLLHLRRVMLIICINSVLIFLIALVIKAMGDVLTVSAADEIYSPSRQNIGADDTLSLRSETGWTDLGDVVSPATVSYAIAQTPNGLLVGGTYDGGPWLYVYDISNGQITSGIAIPGSGGYIDSIVAGQGTSVYATVSHAFNPGGYLIEYDTQTGEVWDRGYLDDEYGHALTVGQDGKVFIGTCCAIPSPKIA